MGEVTPGGLQTSYVLISGVPEISGTRVQVVRGPAGECCASCLLQKGVAGFFYLRGSMCVLAMTTDPL